MLFNLIQAIFDPTDLFEFFHFHIRFKFDLYKGCVIESSYNIVVL